MPKRRGSQYGQRQREDWKGYRKWIPYPNHRSASPPSGYLERMRSAATTFNRSPACLTTRRGARTKHEYVGSEIPHRIFRKHETENVFTTYEAPVSASRRRVAERKCECDVYEKRYGKPLKYEKRYDTMTNGSVPCSDRRDPGIQVSRNRNYNRRNASLDRARRSSTSHGKIKKSRLDTRLPTPNNRAQFTSRTSDSARFISKSDASNVNHIQSSHSWVLQPKREPQIPSKRVDSSIPSFEELQRTSDRKVEESLRQIYRRAIQQPSAKKRVVLGTSNATPCQLAHGPRDEVIVIEDKPPIERHFSGNSTHTPVDTQNEQRASQRENCQKTTQKQIDEACRQVLRRFKGNNRANQSLSGNPKGQVKNEKEAVEVIVIDDNTQQPNGGHQGVAQGPTRVDNVYCNAQRRPLYQSTCLQEAPQQPKRKNRVNCNPGNLHHDQSRNRPEITNGLTGIGGANHNPASRPPSQSSKRTGVPQQPNRVGLAERKLSNRLHPQSASVREGIEEDTHQEPIKKSIVIDHPTSRPQRELENAKDRIDVTMIDDEPNVEKAAVTVAKGQEARFAWTVPARATQCESGNYSIPCFFKRNSTYMWKRGPHPKGYRQIITFEFMYPGIMLPCLPVSDVEVLYSTRSNMYLEEHRQYAKKYVRLNFDNSFLEEVKRRVQFFWREETGRRESFQTIKGIKKTKQNMTEVEMRLCSEDCVMDSSGSKKDLYDTFLEKERSFIGCVHLLISLEKRIYDSKKPPAEIVFRLGWVLVDKGAKG